MTTTSFHREYPQAPELNEVEKGDVVGAAQAREQWVRRRAIHLEKVKIFRQHLVDCNRREGVNHLKNCAKEVEDYMTAFRAYRNEGKIQRR